MSTRTPQGTTVGRAGDGLPPEPFVRLVGRFDPDVLRVGSRPARLRLRERGGAAWDVHLTANGAVLRPPGRHVPSSGLLADASVWAVLADDARQAYRRFFDGSLR